MNSESRLVAGLFLARFASVLARSTGYTAAKKLTSALTTLMGPRAIRPDLPPKPIPAGYTVSRAWRLLLKDLGFHPAAVLQRARLPGDLFSRESASLDSLQYFRLLIALEEEATEADETELVPLPLRFAQAMSADWFDAALFAALCSVDLNAALLRIAKYKRLVAPINLKVDITPSVTALSLEWLDEAIPPPRVAVAIELVFFVQLARLATRTPVKPLGLVSSVPLDAVSQYESYFGCTIETGRIATLVFSAADAQRPFLTADHGMWSFFEPALSKRLHELHIKASMTERVRSALLEGLPAGSVAMEAISRKLGVSSRTLQRRLQGEGSGYQQILDNVRMSLAQHYLEFSSMNGAEIAFLLGFEDPNSFVRAFHGWTGTTPKASRAARENREQNFAE
jgi:AraC-like DNA-binding protein